MSDKPDIVERYMLARTSHKLMRSTTDILAAAGMAGHKHGLAIQLWALLHTPSRQLHSRVSDKLAVRLAHHMRLHGMQGKPRIIARQVVAWHMDHVCNTCHGRGLEHIEGTPHLSDTTCKACDGTGFRRLTTDNDEAAHWLREEVSNLTAMAAIAIAKKLY